MGDARAADFYAAKGARGRLQEAAPRRQATNEGRRDQDSDPQAQEAQLGQQKVCAGASIERQGGHGVRARRGPQHPRA